jgi:hypothetical protein
MKTSLVAVRTLFALSILSSCSWLALPACAAGSGQALPPLLEAGFLSWAKGGGVDAILNGWQRGGLMEGGSKAAVQARYFRNLSSTLGNYRSRELIQSKTVSQWSEVIYISINFERGLVYGRFLLYKTEKDWVVQNMDFSERPEAIMPWLAVQGESATQ